MGRRHISTSGFASTVTETAVFVLFCPYSQAIGTRWYKWTFQQQIMCVLSVCGQVHRTDIFARNIVRPMLHLTRPAYLLPIMSRPMGLFTHYACCGCFFSLFLTVPFYRNHLHKIFTVVRNMMTFAGRLLKGRCHGNQLIFRPN